MSRYIEYLGECFLIVRCLITRRHKMDYSFIKNVNTGDMFQLTHCAKCNRYWI